MSIEQLREAIPDYAKDLKINLGNVLSGSSLPPLETYGAALASALVAKQPTVIRALSLEAQQHLSATEIDAVASAAAIMGMTNVWYKLAGIQEDAEVKQIPPRLRMQVMVNHGGVPKRSFEVFSLAASIVNACPVCITSHTAVLRQEGLSAQQIADIGRIAAVVKAVADTLAFNQALVRPAALAA
jgi:alkyl hydroperoxide reductase subunit D